MRSPLSYGPRPSRSLPTALIPALIVAAVVPAALLLAVAQGADPLSRSVHAASTLLVGAAIAVLGGLVARRAYELRDARTMLGALATGISSLLVLADGILLAGEMAPDAMALRLSQLLVLPLGSLVLLLARLRAVVRPGRELIVARSGAISLAITWIVCVLWLASPDAVDLTMPAGGTASMAIFGVTSVLLGLLALSALRTALLTRRPLDLLVCAGLVWLIFGQFALATSVLGDARWAAGHALMFLGFSLLALQTIVDLVRHTSSRSLIGGIRASALVEQSSEFLGVRVAALVERLVEKDPSTAGHVERVAMLAVQMGEHLHLPTGRLRLLAAGALLHDIGKLSVPTDVLQKPARLTDEEFVVVQRHPSDGRVLLSELGGFHPLVLELVESHHERLDGTGYPHQRSGQELPLEVRILAVADVFDALTTRRPYREACSAGDALRELDSQAGTGLDARCVAALRDVLRGDQLIDIGQRARHTVPAHTTSAAA